MSKPYRSLKYLREFQCIGPECEDTCCQGWQVNLYEDDFEKLRKLFQSKKELRHYMLSIDLHPDEKRNLEDYGVLAFGNNNHCPMLNDGWCVLHRDHGEKMLPRVCATFPKNIIRLPDKTEVHGLLACPEVARQCLLEEEPPVAADYPRDKLPAIFEHSDFSEDEPDLYQRGLPRLVELTSWIMSLKDKSESQKNYLIAYFLKRVSAFYRKGMERDPSKRLESITARMEKPEFIEKTLQAFQPTTVWEPKLIELLVGVLNATFMSEQRKRYSDMCEEVLASFGEAGGNVLRFHILTPDRLDAIWSEFLERRKKVLAVFENRLERYFLNFSMNFWSQSLYKSYETPELTACEFAMTHSVLRFLMISHPLVIARVDDPQSKQTRETLDKTIVAVVQPFMKHISANSQLMKSIVKGMTDANLSNLPSLAALLMV